MRSAGAVIGIVVVLVIVLGAIAWYINGLNRVVRLHEQVKSQWGQVETMLQRRNDLIPNLVSTVQGYATHETELFEQIARLRSQWSEAKTVPEKIENARQMETAIGRLMVVVENYPQLRAVENFQTLMAQLEGAENRISTERVRYNEAARAFNTYIQEVFGKMFAKRRNLTEQAPYFEAAPGAEKVPEVKFN